MIEVTGIELGPDCCVLVRAGGDPSRTTVTAARAVTPGEWSDDRDTLAGLLRSAKRSNRLSSHARVVAWGLPESGASADLAHLPELGPLVAAGFEIDSIVSPVRALADLVKSRRETAADEGTAALSLNGHGVAIAIVSAGKVVASRVFEWPLGRPFNGANSEQLDRYLVISQIAPELQHLIDFVRPVHGVTVTSVVACGNLPNLRSLSMLLIEEMDLEVETLDSVDLLDPQGAGRLADLVPTLQLAALAAAPRDTPHAGSDNRGGSGPGVEREDRALESHRSPYGADRPRPGSALVQFTAVAATFLLTTWTALAVSGSSPATPVFPGGLEVASTERPAIPDIPAEATVGRIEAPAPTPALSPAPSKVAGTFPAKVPATLASDDARIPRVPGTFAAKVPATLASPAIPSVTGVVIAGDRRIAIVGGLLVNVGGQVGQLTVTQIDRDGVVLREPGGREVRVAIRMRKPPAGGP
jgi:hypothetical protein